MSTRLRLTSRPDLVREAMQAHDVSLEKLRRCVLHTAIDRVFAHKEFERSAADRRSRT